MLEEVGTEISDINITKPSKPSIEEKKRLLEISTKYGIEIME
jgi:hypothetical protein